MLSSAPDPRAEPRRRATAAALTDNPAHLSASHPASPPPPARAARPRFASPASAALAAASQPPARPSTAAPAHATTLVPYPATWCATPANLPEAGVIVPLSQPCPAPYVPFQVNCRWMGYLGAGDEAADYFLTVLGFKDAPAAFEAYALTQTPPSYLREQPNPFNGCLISAAAVVRSTPLAVPLGCQLLTASAIACGR